MYKIDLDAPQNQHPGNNLKRRKGSIGLNASMEKESQASRYHEHGAGPLLEVAAAAVTSKLDLFWHSLEGAGAKKNKN